MTNGNRDLRMALALFEAHRECQNDNMSVMAAGLMIMYWKIRQAGDKTLQYISEDEKKRS